jgi:hypothetical protein
MTFESARRLRSAPRSNLARRRRSVSSDALSWRAARRSRQAESLAESAVGRIARGDCLRDKSGRPGCCHPGLRQIRTCATNASGSSDVWFRQVEDLSGRRLSSPVWHYPHGLSSDAFVARSPLASISLRAHASCALFAPWGPSGSSSPNSSLQQSAPTSHRPSPRFVSLALSRTVRCRASMRSPSFLGNPVRALRYDAFCICYTRFSFRIVPLRSVGANGAKVTNRLLPTCREFLQRCEQHRRPR